MHTFFITIIVKIFPLFLAIALHEIAHALVAYLLGDDTAKNDRRFNLHTHFDFYGSFLIPLIMFLAHSPFLIGYAKPVPIDIRKFKDPIKDMALVAIAGPLSNLIMALCTAFFLKEMYMYCPKIILQMCMSFLVINLALMFFNLIPIPPLDGSRLVAAVIPKTLVGKFYSLEPFGFIIVISLELLSNQISKMIGHDVSLFYLFIQTPVRGMLNFLLS